MFKSTPYNPLLHIWNQFSAKINTLRPEHIVIQECSQKEENYHISDVFDLIIPHMPLLDSGNHRDGAAAAICRVLHSFFVVIFGLLLGVARRSWTAVWRGSGVIIRRVQGSRVILFSLSILLCKIFYCEGPAVLCTPAERERNDLKLVLLYTSCCYSPFSQNTAWLNLAHNSWPGRNMPLCY